MRRATTRSEWRKAWRWARRGLRAFGTRGQAVRWSTPLQSTAVGVWFSAAKLDPLIEARRDRWPKAESKIQERLRFKWVRPLTKDLITSIGSIPLFANGERVTTAFKCESIGTVVDCTHTHCTVVWDEPGNPTMRYTIEVIERVSVDPETPASAGCPERVA